MGEWDDRQGGDGGGPRTAFILTGTAVAAVVVTAPTEPPAPGEDPATRLFTRTTDTGVEIRVDSVGAEMIGGGPGAVRGAGVL